MSYSKIGIIYRKNTIKAETVALEAATWLTDKKLKVFRMPDQAMENYPPIDNLENVDLILVLGGDGTYLEAVQRLNGAKTPILGVNMGALGFLTDTREEDLYPLLERALNGELELRPRSMLKVKVKRGEQIKEYSSLNDVVLERGAESQLLHLDMFQNKNHINHIKADGIIVSTPTGSTAYNLAAGGPILHPEVSAFVLTPICPHSLTNRPTLLPDDFEFSVKLTTEGRKGTLVVDGDKVDTLNCNDEVFFKQSSNKHYLLKKPEHNYFDLLREKLSFGQRN